jgi:hypothetical protein
MSLITRVQNILLKPKEEWGVIAGEATSVGQLFTGYAMILAAIPLVATIIGMLAFAPRVGGMVISYPIGMVIAIGVVGYIVQLCVVYLMGLIIAAIAPSQGGTNDKLSGFKMSVYASTPVWVAGILGIFPPLAPLVWLAYLYVIYLIYTGVGPLLKVPADKAAVATVIIVVAYIVLVIVLSVVIMGVLLGIFASMFMTGATVMGV